MNISNSPYQSASLYVGDLDRIITESQLFDIFKAVGPVASIRVCRDTVTRQSLGYAYVNFHNSVDAQRALDTLNYTPIKGKPCRIMWSQRDPSIRKSGQGNIFISKLDESIDNKALYDTFSTFGNILSCKVVTDEKGESKGYGFVHYETQEAAEQAIEKVNGMLLNGKLVHVLPFKSRSQRHPETTPNQFTNIYVKHFPKNWGDEDLKNEFSVFGEIQSVAIQKGDGDVSRGFGFVNFHQHAAAQQAIEKLHLQKTIGGEERPLYVQRAMRRNEREIFLKKLRDERAQRYQGINLYVKNLDDSVDNNKLRDEFAQFGKISSAVVMEDKGASRGFGFVCFSTSEEAAKALAQMHNQMLAGKPLYVAYAERSEIRRAKLAAQYAARAAMRMSNANMSSGGQMYGTPVFYPTSNPRTGMVAYPVSRMRTNPAWINAPGMRPVQYRSGGGGGGGNYGGQGRTNMNSSSNQQFSHGGNRSSGGNNNNNNNSGNQQYKYAQNTRNPAMSGQQGGGPYNRMQMGNQNPQLMYGNPAQTRQYLGENLYPKIRSIEPGLAPKITGMLLESLRTDDILHLLDNPDSLKEKISEAVNVLKDHQEQIVTTNNNNNNSFNENKAN